VLVRIHHHLAPAPHAAAAPTAAGRRPATRRPTPDAVAPFSPRAVKPPPAVSAI
jgi:hypothetical protein